MIKSFVFDLDGTLMDSEILWVEALERAMKDNGHPISHQDSLDIVYGKSWPHVYSQVNKRFPGLFPTMDGLDAEMRRHFMELRKTRDIRINGSIDLLVRLSQDFPVCIVSGASRRDVEDAIAFMDIDSNLAFYISCEDYSASKPDPACYLLAAERLQLPPKKCLVFEDATAGIVSAKKAGMYCVALQRKGAPQQDTSLADETLEDLSEFDVQRWTCGCSAKLSQKQ